MTTTDAPFTHASFERFLSEGRLMGCRSASSGRLYVPPRPICPESWSDDMAWEQVSGEGTLVAYSVVHIAPTAMIEAGYGRHNPYCVGVVELGEGPRISGQILGVDVSRPETIEVGARVVLEVVRRGEGESARPGLAFRVVG